VGGLLILPVILFSLPVYSLTKKKPLFFPKKKEDTFEDKGQKAAKMGEE